ncbi:hypothetical protein DNTS_005483 [Danionella cerebrum]|uniref:IRG-type G domain-containing protein n=1 Tax=Danionella cerebrum TaxID=2873325 RepID=A0A553PYK6_9TELE|nr:hypothetical protein DNTS_005483 [Danionella translucida]
MEEKLSNEKVKQLLAPWRFSFRSPGFENRLVVALQLFEHFPLDIAVTGGTREANAKLASLICGLSEDTEESETEGEETDEDKEEQETKLKDIHQSSRTKRVRISEHAEHFGSGSVDFTSVISHSQIPNVRIFTVQGHPTSNSITKRQNDYTCYDVLVILTTKEHNEDHMWFKVELLEQVNSLYLVQAEQYWDVVEEKPTGPCMTCAWERMRARKLELDKRNKERFGESVKSLEKLSSSNFSEGSELVKMEDIAKVLSEAIPWLRRKAFSQFMVMITKDLWVHKLLADDTQSAIHKSCRKINEEDYDQIYKFFQTRDLTDNPAKLQAILEALDHFWLDVGVLGYTGCGSSSLVNALLGLENGSEQVASVGVKETTIDVVKYTYPNSPRVRLWDLPGLGKIGDLSTLPATSSPEAPHVASLLALCDVYILVSPLRLGLGSLQLLQQASTLGKECYLVLSMADLIEETSVVEVKQWTEEVLAKLGLEQRLFIVSSHQPKSFDLPKLKEMLIARLPGHKKVALARYVSKQLDENVFWKRSDSCACIINQCARLHSVIMNLVTNGLSVRCYLKPKILGKMRRRVHDMRNSNALASSLDLSHNESTRLAMDALLDKGLEGYQEQLMKENEANFLCGEEKSYILNNVRRPHTGEEEADGDEEVSGSSSDSSETYFPALTESEPPALDYGWPVEEWSYHLQGLPIVEACFRSVKSSSMKDLLRELIQQASKVLAIVMDTFTDVEIFCDILEATRKRNVYVYLLLDHTNVQMFQDMCESVQINKSHLSRVSIRSVQGETYCAKSGTRFSGQVQEKFIIVDCTKVLVCSFSLTWLSWQVHRNLAVLFKGSGVKPFDLEFRRLYAISKPVPGFSSSASNPSEKPSECPAGLTGDLLQQKPFQLQSFPKPPALQRRLSFPILTDGHQRSQWLQRRTTIHHHVTSQPLLLNYIQRSQTWQGFQGNRRAPATSHWCNLLK